MDEYIDNLHILKKHLEFHFKDKKQVSYAVKPLFICEQSMIHYLDNTLINHLDILPQFPPASDECGNGT